MDVAVFLSVHAFAEANFSFLFIDPPMQIEKGCGQIKGLHLLVQKELMLCLLIIINFRHALNRL